MSDGIDLPSLRQAIAARPRETFAMDGFRSSAVLVPILVEPAQPDRLIFIVRDPGMRAHAGQVAFPGGARDAGDADLVDTAIREAREELGIEARRDQVLGMLDDVPTPTGFVITPVVASVQGPVELAPSKGEVAEAFLAELARLADPAAHSDAGEREWMGVRYAMHQYTWEPWNIWGATARILHQLLELLHGEKVE